MSPSLAFLDVLGGSELLVIMFVVLLLFGADRMPGLARGIGKSLREFKKAASSVEEELRRAMDEAPVPPAKKPPGAIQQAAPEKPARPPDSAD
jgi:sec-independent protein translocase protein TatA